MPSSQPTRVRPLRHCLLLVTSREIRTSILAFLRQSVAPAKVLPAPPKAQHQLESTAVLVAD